MNATSHPLIKVYEEPLFRIIVDLRNKCIITHLHMKAPRIRYFLDEITFRDYGRVLEEMESITT